MMRKLTKTQSDLVLVWAAEGLRLPEINDRAAKEADPFEVTWFQLKTARGKSRKFTELQKEAEESAINQGLARKAGRIRQLEELFDRALRVIIERADSETTANVPGGRTGLLVRDIKHLTEVFKFDAALVREMRGILEDIAKEKGERSQKVELSDPNGEPLFESLAKALNKAYGSES